MAAASASVWATGWTVDGGRISLVERVADGTDDAVWRGVTRDGAPVLAVLAGPRDVDAEALRARLAFDHPAIAPLDFVGAPDPGVPYASALVERLPAGAPARGPLAPHAVAALGVELATVLAAEHAAGRVVVGLRPELIYVADGRLAGLVPRGPAFLAAAPASTRGLRSYHVLYTSPEVATSGGPATRACDVFALCTCLFELATGAHPFGDPEQLGPMFARLLAGEVSPWTGPPALGDVLRRGMSPGAAARPTAGELASALADLTG